MNDFSIITLILFAVGYFIFREEVKSRNKEIESLRTDVDHLVVWLEELDEEAFKYDELVPYPKLSGSPDGLTGYNDAVREHKDWIRFVQLFNRRTLRDPLRRTHRDVDIEANKKEIERFVANLPPGRKEKFYALLKDADEKSGIAP
jgi:hypothetical protein